MTQKTRRPSRNGARHIEYKYDDSDDGARPVTLDARSLTLPSVAIIAVVMSSVGLTYFLAAERGRLDKRIDTVVGSVERLATSISQLADGLRYGASDRFTFGDLTLFCARTESINKGWHCGQIESKAHASSTGKLRETLDGVSRETGEIRRKILEAPED